jgi:hypothetical protein
MIGKILIFDYINRRGIIEDSDKNRYKFHIGEWLSDKEITIGEEVYFEIPIVEEAINIRVKERHCCLQHLIDRFKFIQGENGC